MDMPIGNFTLTIAYATTGDLAGRKQGDTLRWMMREWRRMPREIDGYVFTRIDVVPAADVITGKRKVDIAIGVFGWATGTSEGFQWSVPAQLLDQASSRGAMPVPVFYKPKDERARKNAVDNGLASQRDLMDQLDYASSLNNRGWELWSCDDDLDFSDQGPWSRRMDDIVGEFTATHFTPAPAQNAQSKPASQSKPAPAPAPVPQSKPAPAPASRPASAPKPQPQPVPSTTPKPQAKAETTGAFWSEDPDFAQRQSQRANQANPKASPDRTGRGGASRSDAGRNVAGQDAAQDRHDRQRQSAGQGTGSAKVTGDKAPRIRGNAYFYGNAAKGINQMPSHIHAGRKAPDTILNKAPDPSSGTMFVSGAQVGAESLAWLQRRLIMGSDAAATLESAWNGSWVEDAASGRLVNRCVFPTSAKGEVAFPIDPADMRDSNVAFVILKKDGQGGDWLFDRFETAGMFRTPAGQLDDFALMRVRKDRRKPISTGTSKNGRSTFLYNVRGLAESYARLAAFAVPEPWASLRGDKDGGVRKDEHGILRAYLSYTFCRCKEQDKVLVSRANGLAVFNTGLKRPNGDDIYAGFERAHGRDEGIRQEWILRDFFNASGSAFGTDAKLAVMTLNIFGRYPAAADYEKPRLDADAALGSNGVTNLSHILFDHLERIPVAFLKDALRMSGGNADDADALGTEEGREAFKGTHMRDDAFLRAVDGQFAQYYRRAITDVSQGKRIFSAYYPPEMRYDENSGTCVNTAGAGVLVPIRFGYQDDPDLDRAVVVVQDGAKTHVRTVFTLPMAYATARVSQSLADVAWLSPGRVFGPKRWA